MASKDQVESLTEEVVCPICLDFFTDPVSLECGHNFCRSCITQSWDREERNSCPECREQFTDRTLRVSRALARLSEKARTLSLNQTEKESKLQCEEHQEELKLFCETDKKLICVVCAGGREHKSHSFTMIAEAAEIYKDQVKSSIQSLTKEKSEIQQMEQQQKQKISGVLEQSHDLQSRITSHYAELHQILIEEEQGALADIREEERKILNTMETNLGNIQENLKSIQEKLLKLQQQMDQNNSVVFLKEETGRKRRVSDEAKPLAMVDEALPIEKFHCPVSFNTTFKETSDDFKQASFISPSPPQSRSPPHSSSPSILPISRNSPLHSWIKTPGKVSDVVGVIPRARFQLSAHLCLSPSGYHPRGLSDSLLLPPVSVILDVETLNPKLEVSEDRMGVKERRNGRRFPVTEKSFTNSPSVLGSEGFTSGRHYWEVDLAGSWRWRLGVAAESVERKGRCTLTPETGVWSIGRWGGHRFEALTSPPSPLTACPIPERVGVYLSYESGTVSFYDADTKSHVHTFTGNEFTEKCYPYIWTQDGSWMRISSGSSPDV
ncbi:zinc-binding protein A33-like [Leucoraja erinacea]|uniref:zinc-binding protein A33-like n=1 Tax=Leucoraja erinaceus TaxID=7782 RepID=UPI002455CEAD|nr:zinc-binding protein A33-like [Leucoraja erinacea]